MWIGMKRTYESLFGRLSVPVLLSAPDNIYYSIGFSTTARRPAQIGLNVVLMTKETTWFVFPENWKPLVEEQEYDEKVILIPYPRTAGEPAETIVQLLDSLREDGCSHRLELGFEKERLELELYLQLEDALRRRGRSIHWQDISSSLRRARLVKSKEELQAMRKSAQVAREAMEYAKTILCPGKSEMEIVAELEYFMRKKGSEGVPFTMKVLSGENAARTINLPGERRIRPGDVVLLDFGAVVEHYASDWTRSFAIEKADSRLIKMYELVWKIEQECIAAVRPGVSFAELMACAERVLENHPLKPWFNPYLGHSIGLNSQEWPSIVPGTDMVLQKNMVITIEPGIYVPGAGGVRIEDEVLVTEDGYEILTGLSKEDFVIRGEGDRTIW